LPKRTGVEKGVNAVAKSPEGRPRHSRKGKGVAVLMFCGGDLSNSAVPLR